MLFDVFPNEILIEICKKLCYRDACNFCASSYKLYNSCFSMMDQLFRDLFDISLYKTMIDDSVIILIPGPLIYRYVDKRCNINGIYHVHLWKNYYEKYKDTKDIRDLVKDDLLIKEGIGFFIRDFSACLARSINEIDKNFIYDYVMNIYDDETRLYKHDLGINIIHKNPLGYVMIVDKAIMVLYIRRNEPNNCFI